MPFYLSGRGGRGGLKLIQGGELLAALEPINLYQTKSAGKSFSRNFNFARDADGGIISLPDRPGDDDLWAYYIPAYDGYTHLARGLVRMAPLWDIRAAANGDAISDGAQQNWFPLPSSGNGWTVLGRTALNQLLIGFNGSPIRSVTSTSDSRLMFLRA